MILAPPKRRRQRGVIKMQNSTPDTAQTKRQANKKRRRSSKKLPAVDTAIDPSVPQIDWTQVSELLSAQLDKKRLQQQRQQKELEQCSKLSKKRRFYKR